MIGGNRRSSTTSEPESIDGAETLGMRQSHWSVSFRNLYGHNQHVISLADSRNTGSIGGLEPITIAQYFGKYFEANEIHRSDSEIVRAQQTPLFIRSPFPIGTLDPISGLVELKQLNLHMCDKLTGTFGCGGTTNAAFHSLSVSE